ncbi:MAG: penicillin acylase family protein [Chloroflexi bacterium]|nr:MAG: penicillin acylase family protein [Chloroflexota bacterium]
MDLMRRQGAGRLSEVVGKAALDSDRFELQLGLLRTARLEWGQISQRLGEPLVAYAQGVNDRIAEAESAHQLDPMFTLLGYKPQPWTPVDSLLVKGDMTQTLNFTDTPLVMALLNKSLGADLASEWFPVQPPNVQAPYDLGPYGRPSIAPIASGGLVSDAEAASASTLLTRLESLPAGLVSKGGASNNWAVAGARSASGGALLAGDPHLHLTLPSIWFQLTMDSPSYHAAGVSIPGTPVVLIGHNEHIAWSLTDAQNQQTFFYVEQEDRNHPGQYYWKGSWQPYEDVTYDIPVLGGATEHLTVKQTVHGPVIGERGQTTSVWWAGNVPSWDLQVLLDVDRASNWREFRTALRGWLSPTHNFVYADDAGNIGLISAGYFPQVAKGQPWLPMPGTGEYDVVGTIPFDDIPQVYNPPDHIIWSANQRQVTKDYPYYIGTASNFFDPGYRADEIRRVLSQPGKLSASDMQALQTDTHDFLGAESGIGSGRLTWTRHSSLGGSRGRSRSTWASSPTPSARTSRRGRFTTRRTARSARLAWGRGRRPTPRPPPSARRSARWPGSSGPTQTRGRGAASTRASSKTSPRSPGSATALAQNAATPTPRWRPAATRRRTDRAGAWWSTGAPTTTRASTRVARARTRRRAGTRTGSTPGGTAG